MSSPLLLAAGLGLGSTLLGMWLALRFDWAALLPRRPPDWHHGNRQPIPRVGGAILVCAFIIVELWIATFYPDVRSRTPARDLIVFCSVAMFALGFWDDLSPLGPLMKLTLQVLIASAVCLGGIGMEVCATPFSQSPVVLGAIGPVLTILWLVCLTNLINLVDGADGLAGGICLMLTALSAIIAHPNGNFEMLAWGMAGALLGFLRYNFPPAKLYLGDGGAYFLGFQIGIYSIVNSQRGTNCAAILAPLFVLALPITDAVLAVLRRGLRGLPLFRPDRKHLHHRLLAGGISRRKLILEIYGLNFVFFLMALLVLLSNGRWVPILAGAAALLLLFFASLFGFSRPWFAVHQVVPGCLRMRGQVRYALSLVHWLEFEARRCKGPGEFWPDLVFAAEKLGFASVKLSLRQEQRCWRLKASPSGNCRKFACLEHNYGMLELKSRACPFGRTPGAEACRCDLDCEIWRGSCLADPRVFDTISDLLAETWNRAVAEWNARNIPLVFGDEKSQSRASAPGFAQRPAALASGLKNLRSQLSDG